MTEFKVPAYEDISTLLAITTTPAKTTTAHNIETAVPKSATWKLRAAFTNAPDQLLKAGCDVNNTDAGWDTTKLRLNTTRAKKGLDD
eukprot:CAMPEP_0180682406 /NCGR_PEP_ID=MMETSP1037_2-20121125/70543_1 /TAXON_ID=632150 /ORGANISM="Azadinium spinosum, Strain 3D9" /LENGTH=86 /DNA_ID=CAMNT_0022712403 /DNA_START=45 /DNA_END=303 /DNA_ORIENTATION=-